MCSPSTTPHSWPASRSTSLRSSAPNQGGSPAAAFSVTRCGLRGRGDRDRDPRVREDVLQERLRPGLDPERCEVLGARRASDERAVAERAHHDDAEAELLGERQDRALDLALARVVRDLDRRDPAAAHDLLELAEGRRAVVRGADRADLALVAQALEQVEPLARVPTRLWTW